MNEFTMTRRESLAAVLAAVSSPFFGGFAQSIPETTWELSGKFFENFGPMKIEVFGNGSIHVFLNEKPWTQRGGPTPKGFVTFYGENGLIRLRQNAEGLLDLDWIYLTDHN